jgi:hypothetical protein
MGPQPILGHFLRAARVRSGRHRCGRFLSSMMRAEAYPRLARRCMIAAERAASLAPHVVLDTIKGAHSSRARCCDAQECGSFQLASFWQFCSLYEKLILIHTYACDSVPPLLSKVFGRRVAFVRERFAHICRSSRAPGATSGRRGPNLSLRRMQLLLHESPHGAGHLLRYSEQAQPR